jgi:beta-lactamase superfamily II metal-dependent hydrolase
MNDARPPGACRSARFLLQIALLTGISPALAVRAEPAIVEIDDGIHVVLPAPSFKLWQLPSVNPGQQINSYVIQTATEERLIVIDGGMPTDAGYLTNFIAARGNRVHMWFISHQHIDHFGALMEVLSRPPSGLVIDAIYGSLLDEAEVIEGVSRGGIHPINQELVPIAAFNASVAAAGKTVQQLVNGQEFLIDRVAIKILRVKDLNNLTHDMHAHGNLINNSSVVMKVFDSHKSVLFTGDLGREGGYALLDSEYGDEVDADYVQMAHHGSHGVDPVAFYTAVDPRYCLWPTTAEIYGAGRDHPRFSTYEVRQVTARLCGNLRSFSGLQMIQ